MTDSSLLKVVRAVMLVSMLVPPQLLRASDDTDPNRASLEMAEDLEVLGAVVAHALERFYREPGAEAPSFDALNALSLLGGDGNPERVGWTQRRLSTSGGQRERGKPLAVHLPGYGVVLQAEARRMREEPSQVGSGGAPGKAPDDWDLARLLLQGSPPPAAEKRGGPTEPTRAEVTDMLVRLLARNGHRLRHLAAGERLTIALEIRDARGSESSRSGNAGAMGTGGASMDPMLSDAIRDALHAQDPALENRLLSGDLHLRQGNYEKAIDSFRRAGDEFRDSSVQARLLHALAAAGKYDEARSVLNELAGSTGSGRGSAAQRPPPSLALPARLVFSATRDSLEKVGSGSMTLEEFRKQVEVTHFQPPVRPGRPGAAGEPADAPAEGTGKRRSASSR